MSSFQYTKNTTLNNIYLQRVYGQQLCHLSEAVKSEMMEDHVLFHLESIDDIPRILCHILKRKRGANH